MRYVVAALTIALAVVAPRAHAEVWKETKAPTVLRAGATLTSLADGTALLVGGSSAPSGAVAVTEVFDPKTETWKTLKPMLVARRDHSAIRLADGRVLVAGGHDALGVKLSSAELFDPATGAWTATPPMKRTHVAPMAIAKSGLVGILGGSGAGRDFEVYDPIANTWATRGSPSFGRDGHAFAPLPDGGFLAIAGGTTSSAERYDPVKDAWTSVASSDPRRYGDAALLADGRVLVAGGGMTPPNGRPLVFDPKTAMFTTLVGQARGSSTSLVPLASGHVVIVGSFALEAGKSPVIEIVDPATDKVLNVFEPVFALGDFNAAALGDGRVLLTFTAPPSVILDLPRTCATAAECASGFCTDGFCCNSACGGQCEACDVGGSLGVCSAVAGAPHGTRTICSPPWTPACRTTSCDGLDRTRCTEPVFRPVCSCSTDSDCSTGHCADGVCCNTACDGQCEACDLPSSRGTCVPVRGEPRGVRKGCPIAGRGICTVQACNGTETKHCTYANGSNENCDTICGGRVQRHCDGEGSCGLPHELKCPSDSCSVASPEPSPRPRFIDALLVLGLATAVSRGARAWRGAPRPSCRRPGR